MVVTNRVQRDAEYLYYLYVFLVAHVELLGIFVCLKPKKNTSFAPECVCGSQHCMQSVNHWGNSGVNEAKKNFTKKLIKR